MLPAILIIFLGVAIIHIKSKVTTVHHRSFKNPTHFTLWSGSTAVYSI